jgi:hypothetical protein
MDYLRVGYTVNMQFDAAGEIVVPITWYPAADGADLFPTPHYFGSSRTWTPHRLPTVGLGERWDSKPVTYAGPAPFYAPGNGAFCGPLAWFQEGCPSDAPPLVIGPAGSPVCCPQPPCQPWGTRSINSRTCVGAGYDAGDWIILDNFGSGVAWFYGANGDSIQLSETLPGCPPSGSSAECLCAFGAYPSVTTLSLESYDLATQTGTWIDPTGTLPSGSKYLCKILLP